MAREQTSEPKLDDKQRAFVGFYLQCWNAAEAARMAGYPANSARQRGHENVTNRYIRAEIESRLSEIAMQADEVLARLANHARGDLSAFITRKGTIDLNSIEAREKFYLLKKARVKQRREAKGTKKFVVEETEIELHDPQAALVHIGRHLKLFTDKLEVDDSGLTDEQRADRIVAILDAARTRRNRQIDAGGGTGAAGEVGGA